MRRRRTTGVLGLLVAAALCAAWAVTLRPESLNGPAGYVMVRGSSMQPTYQPGDLVITRHQHTYKTGDIVAYRVPEGEVGEGATLIHRIVGGSAHHGYVIQGDNNPVPDEWRPDQEDVIGKAWLNLPKAGEVLFFLRAPAPLASIAAGVAVAIVLVPASGAQLPGNGGRPGEGDDGAIEDEEKKRRRRKDHGEHP